MIQSRIALANFPKQILHVELRNQMRMPFNLPLIYMYTEAMNSFVYPSSHRAKLLNIFEGLYIYHIHKNCHRFTYIYIPLTVAGAI